MPAFEALRAAQSAQLAKAVVALGLMLLAALVAIGWLSWSMIAQGRDHAAAMAKTRTEHTEQLRFAAEINDSANAAVESLQRSLVECRGESQAIARRLSRAIHERDQARARITREAQAGVDALNRILESHDACRDRPVCRPLSDELRRRWAQGPAD